MGTIRDNTKKVSVIIPTYNREMFISNAIRSVINQNHQNIEIIVVDDGSTDDTAQVVHLFKKKYPQILYYQNERNKGPSGARNTGIIHSAGDYLTFLDSDDIWLDGQLAYGLKILDEHPEIDVLFGNFQVVDFNTGEHQYNFFDRKEILHRLKSIPIASHIRLLDDNIFQALIQENFVHFGSLIMKNLSKTRILLDEFLIYAEDRDFAIRLYKDCNAKFAFREDPVFVLHRHDSNLNSSGDINVLHQILLSHIHLFSNYLRKYSLTIDEKIILRKDICKKLVNLSYIHWVNKQPKQSLSYAFKSFKHFISLMHLRAMQII